MKSVPAGLVRPGEVFIAQHPDEVMPRYWICIYPGIDDKLRGESVFRYAGKAKNQKGNEFRYSLNKYITLREIDFVVLDIDDDEEKERRREYDQKIYDRQKKAFAKSES